MKKPDPHVWLAWVLASATGTTVALSKQAWWAVWIGLVVLACSGGELAVQNIKWRIYKGEE